MRALILDSSFYPIKVVPWQKAIVLVLTGRAETIDLYENKTIRTVHDFYQLPRILKLHSRHRGHFQVKFSRENVFLRDAYTCQYCNRKFQVEQLTFDHVIPLSRGGETSWENIVTCCRKCNCAKGNKFLQEFHLKLHVPPRAPKWSPQIVLKLKRDDPKEWFNWIGAGLDLINP